MTPPRSERSQSLSPAKRALLERRLRGERSQGNALQRLDVPPRPARLPLSYGQRRLWFIDRLFGKSPHYNLTGVMVLQGELDRAALDRTIATLVERHEVLRTRFTEVDGEPAQVIDSVVRIEPSIVDLAGLDREEQRRRILAEAQRERAQPFDLARGPLMRLTVFKKSEAEHVLFRTVHHIAWDGWSDAIFNREFRLLYDAYRHGADNPLAPLPMQYADFALWQRRQLTGPAQQELLAYWTRQLAGVPPTLDLPTARPRPAAQTLVGEIHGVLLSREQAAMVRQLCSAQQATVYMTMLAIFGVMLSRYTGRDDFVIGSPTANRPNAALEALVGFFVDSLVLRLRVRSAMRFRELLAQVSRTALEAYQHQDVSFERLVEALAPPRRLDTTPVFQVMFGLLPTPAAPSVSAGPEAEMAHAVLTALVTSGEQPARFELEVHAWERQGRIGMTWLYNRHLFDRSWIARMARHYVRILEAVAADPDIELRRIDLMDAEERNEVIGMCPPPAPAERRATIMELVEAQAARTPNATAVVCGSERASYAEVNARANRLAHELVANAIGPEDIVGLALPRSVDLVIALLGVLKAGAAYLPLDPAGHPNSRLAFMLQDASPTCVIATRELAASLPPETRTVLLDEPATQAVLARRPARNPDDGARVRPVGGYTPAYVMYTSGSTGTPKGVIVEHAALATFAHGVSGVVPFAPGARHVAITTPAFDISILELLLPLCRGAEVIVAAADEVHDPVALTALVRRHEATSMQATPSYWSLLIRQDALPPLRALVGGEALTADLARALSSTARHVCNLYGPTEATIWASSHAIGERDLADGAPGIVSIGRPLPSHGMYVLDQSLAPSPLGVPGELYISGQALARGYLRRVGLTATRFVANPYGLPGTRMYRTGDLARWSSDGTLEFMGRVDYQVKIRGFRVELGEIEEALRAHELVDDAVVTLQENGPDKRLLGYVLRSESEAERTDATVARLREWQLLYDSVYAASHGFAPDFDTVDWVSSYTGQPIPAVEMGQWVAEAVGRIGRLGAGDVIEVGCGTGLLLTRLAPACRRYVGVDFSPTAIAQLRRYVATRTDLARVELREGLAHELAFLGDDAVDLVVLNSTVQYFPDVDYLVAVLKEAVRVTRPGGDIFVGGVRSLGLLRAFHTSVQLHKADADVPVPELRRRIRDAQRHEKELLVDPRLFDELARRWSKLGRVEKFPKTGAYDNEMSRFRYDVVLHLGEKQAAVAPPRWLIWDPAGDWRHGIEQALDRDPTTTIGVRGLPDRRVSGSVQAARWLEDRDFDEQTAGDLRAAPADVPGDDLASVLSLIEGRRVPVSWNRFGDDGTYALIVNGHWRPADGGAEASGAYYRRYGNVPARGREGGDPGRVLQEHLRASLPEHMVPAVITVLPAWPLTPSGKVDRQALPSPEYGSNSRYRPPQTWAEEMLCCIFADVLGADAVGADDSFFELGGHSLMAMRVITRLHDALGVSLPVGEFLERPTIAALAARLEAMVTQDRSRPSDRIERIPRRGSLPLSFNQEKYLFRQWWASGQGLPSFPFQMNLSWRLRGELDADALERALNEIVRRHELLRASFTRARGSGWLAMLSPLVPRLLGLRSVRRAARALASAGTAAPSLFRQRIVEAAALRLRFVDLSAMDAQQRHAERQRLPELTAPFDLTAPPLVRAALLKLGAGDHLLAIAVSHVVFDGWSENIMRRELATLYNCFANGKPSPLPELPVQYVDFAAWERRRLTGDLLEQLVAYWRRQLPDFSFAGSPLHLGELTFHRRAPVQTYRSAFAVTAVDAGLYWSLQQLCVRYGVTMYMLLLAALSGLLHRSSSRERIALWASFANRTRPEVQDLIGWFAQWHLLSVSLAGNPPFTEVLRRTRDVVVGAIAHQELPVALFALSQADGSKTELGPRPQISFDVRREAQAEALSDSPVTMNAEVAAGAQPITDWGLHIVAMERPQSLKIFAQYSIDWFTAESVREMLAGLQTLLHAAAAQPSAAIGDLAIVRPATTSSARAIDEAVDASHAVSDRVVVDVR